MDAFRWFSGVFDLRKKKLLYEAIRDLASIVARLSGAYGRFGISASVEIIEIG